MNGFEAAYTLAVSFLAFLRGPIGAGIGGWLLAIIFLWSGIAKLRQPALPAMALVQFGVVRHFRPRLGWLLGSVEVLLGVLLGLNIGAQISRALAAILLWCFVFLIARSLHAGHQFACACFGNADDMLSRWTLARTTALAVLATLLSISVPPALLPDHFDLHNLLYATAALSLLGIIVLASYVPRLLQWNRFPATEAAN